MIHAGKVHPVPPEPHDPAQTTMVAAGTVTIGVEYREIDVASLSKSFQKLGLKDEFLETIDDPNLADRGVSLHVFGPDGHEYLRFDCFEDGPHYHYNHKTADGSAYNHQVLFDPVSNGDELTWALNCLRTRLPEMLAEAHGEDVAAALDYEALRIGIDQVERLIRKP